MARSNGIPDRTTGQPARPVRGTAQPVEHGLPWNPANAQPGAYPADPQFAPHGYDQPPAGRPTPSPAQLPWPQAGQPVTLQPHPQQTYAAAPPQAYAQPQSGYPAQAAYPPASYASDPHHGHYFPPAAAEQPQAYASQAYPDAPAQLRGSFPGHGEPAYPPLAQNAAYQAQPQYAPQQPHAQPGHDPRGYELGAYATTPPPYTDPATGRGPTQPAPQTGYANAYAPQHPGQQAQFNPGAAQPAAQHPDAHPDTEFDDEEFEDEEEEAPRRFGLLKVVASLVVAIGIGAGGAYGYKKFANPTVAGVRPMAARADAPTKQQTASADLKAGERLNDVPAVVPSGDTNGDGNSPAGARRVQTIPITPQGIPGMAVQQPPMRPTISVPGMAIDGMVASSPPPAAALPPVVPAPAARVVAPPPVVQAQPPRAPVAPRVIAAVEEPAAAPVPPRAAPKVAVPKVAKSNDAYLPGGAPSQVGAAPVTASTAVAPAKVATNGYVAVLDSRGSAIDARKALDELQGRFGEVLGGKPTDVAEFANPKDGKTYYRAIVGPPGSREAAANVCTQIKAAGHKDCFAAAY